MLNEQWRDIPGFEGYYQVSDLGRLMSVERSVWVAPSSRSKSGYHRKINARILRPSLSNGYHSYVLWIGHVSATIRAHHAVARAFIGPRPDGMYVCHIDGNRQNNGISNLYYGSPSQNIEDMRRHGTMKSGGDSPNAKLTATDIANIRNLSRSVSQSRLSKTFGISQSHVSRIVNRQAWTA